MSNMEDTPAGAIVASIARTTVGERVVVYGLPLGGDTPHLNGHFATVQCYCPRRNLFCVDFADPSVELGLWLPGKNLFFCSHAAEYFARPVDTLEWITDYTAVKYDARCRPSVVATKPIPAGALLGCPSVRVSMTREQIAAVEAKFEAFLSGNLFQLMRRPSGSVAVVFEPNYNPVLPFVGEVAKRMRHPVIQTVNSYDPTADACLEQEWRRCSGVDLLWLEFWRTELPHLPALEVWHVWHLVRNFPWPSLDRRTLVFGQTICLMQCHPQRVAEYAKVADGLQDAAVDHLAHRYLSTFMMTPPECGDAMKAYFMHDVEVGQPVYTDCGTTFASNLCDTMLNSLFMSPEDGDQWFCVHTTILGRVSTHVARSFLAYFEANAARVRLLRPAPSVRTTPSVHAPPAPQRFPLCDYCAKPMQFRYVCGLCKDTAYCRKACQTAAWKTHKPACKPAQ